MPELSPSLDRLAVHEDPLLAVKAVVALLPAHELAV